MSGWLPWPTCSGYECSSGAVCAAWRSQLVQQHPAAQAQERLDQLWMDQSSHTLDFIHGSVSPAAYCFTMEQNKTWVIGRSPWEDKPASPSPELSCACKSISQIQPHKWSSWFVFQRGRTVAGTWELCSTQQHSQELLGLAGATLQWWAMSLWLWKKGFGLCVLPPISLAGAAMSLSSNAANIREQSLQVKINSSCRGTY